MNMSNNNNAPDRMRKYKWLISLSNRYTQSGEMKDDWIRLGGLDIGIQLAEPTRAPSQKCIY